MQDRMVETPKYRRGLENRAPGAFHSPRGADKDYMTRSTRSTVRSGCALVVAIPRPGLATDRLEHALRDRLRGIRLRQRGGVLARAPQRLGVGEPARHRGR